MMISSMVSCSDESKRAVVYFVWRPVHREGEGEFATYKLFAPSVVFAFSSLDAVQPVRLRSSASPRRKVDSHVLMHAPSVNREEMLNDNSLS